MYLYLRPWSYAKSTYLGVFCFYFCKCYRLFLYKQSCHFLIKTVFCYFLSNVDAFSFFFWPFHIAWNLEDNSGRGYFWFVSDLRDKAFSLSALNKLYCFHNSILSSWLANELGMYYVIFIIALVYNIHVSLLIQMECQSMYSLRLLTVCFFLLIIFIITNYTIFVLNIPLCFKEI